MNTSFLSRRLIVIALAITGCLSAQAQTNGPGYAFSFGSASNSASIATTGSLSGVFTVECWANPGDPAATMGLAGSQSPGDESFAMMFFQGNTMHGEIGNGSNWLTTAADAPLTYTTNVWYHIAYVVTPTNYTIYINGVQAGGGSYAQDNPVLFDADHQLFLGGTGSNSENLIGLLDEVRIWNTARTQVQIQANMNQSLSLPQAGLVGYWRFDEGAGTDLFDSSTNGFTGTLPDDLGWVPSTAPIDSPLPITGNATNLTATSATLNGTMNPFGQESLAWFQYGQTTSYGNTTAPNDVGSDTNTVAVTNVVGALNPGTTYHYQLVATTPNGNVFGADQTFTTSTPSVPAVTTQPATNITTTNATLSALVNPNGAPASVYFQYGLDTNYGIVSTTNNYGSDVVSISLTNLITGLSPGTTYHFQAVAFNSAGTNSGADLSFITPALPPVVTTQPATNITATNATLSALVNPNGALTSVYFQYGLDTNYGSVTGMNNVTGGNASLTVTNFIAGLSPGTTYHFQVAASNSAGITLGADALFNTLPPTPAFTTVSSGLPGVTDGSVAWGDFDNDGKLDVLLSGIDAYGNPLCQVWRNVGDGTFTNINAGLPGVFYGAAAWGDFDNDGYLDILLTGIATDGSLISQVWRNQGNGTFSNINASLPGVYYGAVAWGDFDNDGKLDILITGHGYSNSICQLWRNLGNGTFSNMNAGLPGMYHSAVSLGDFNNDGNLDVLLSGYDTDVGFITQVWRNQGDGTFTNINVGLPGVIEGGVALGDFDNDGYLDLVLSGLSSDGVTPLTQIWRNQGDGTFTNINAGLPGVYRSAVAWGDFDNDGYLDLVFSGLSSDGATPMAQVWRNVGNGTFTNINAALTGVYNASVAWGDYNQNGRLDLLLVGQGTAGIISQLAQNDSIRADNPPSAPTGLAAMMLTNCVLLNWNAANSPQTPTHGLSYNLRVGTTPGGADVFAPQSDVTTGLRRVPQIGNAGTQLTFILTNLAVGTRYYWSVQGIDTAFAGSPFASEGTFSSVMAIQPVITGYGLGTNSQFQILFNASAGVSYTLYGTTNLLSPAWTNLANLVAPSNGPAQLTDPTVATLPASFYRLSTP